MILKVPKKGLSLYLWFAFILCWCFMGIIIYLMTSWMYDLYDYIIEFLCHGVGSLSILRLVYFHLNCYYWINQWTFILFKNSRKSSERTDSLSWQFLVLGQCLSPLVPSGPWSTYPCGFPMGLLAIDHNPQLGRWILGRSLLEMPEKAFETDIKPVDNDYLDNKKPH